VRAELAAFLERRTALDRACHDVLTAQERDRDQHLTDAHVDQRIRWGAWLGGCRLCGVSAAKACSLRFANPLASQLPAPDARRCCHECQHASDAPPPWHFLFCRAVWQVVTGVAEAIRLLHDRYAPDAQSKEAERHIRCTGKPRGAVGGTVAAHCGWAKGAALSCRCVLGWNDALLWCEPTWCGPSLT
jgi:hypothetical protein